MSTLDKIKEKEEAYLQTEGKKNANKMLTEIRPKLEKIARETRRKNLDEVTIFKCGPRSTYKTADCKAFARFFPQLDGFHMWHRQERGSADSIVYMGFEGRPCGDY